MTAPDRSQASRDATVPDGYLYSASLAGYLRGHPGAEVWHVHRTGGDGICETRIEHDGSPTPFASEESALNPANRDCGWEWC